MKGIVTLNKLNRKYLLFLGLQKGSLSYRNAAIRLEKKVI